MQQAEKPTTQTVGRFISVMARAGSAVFAGLIAAFDPTSTAPGRLPVEDANGNVFEIPVAESGLIIRTPGGGVYRLDTEDGENYSVTPGGPTVVRIDPTTGELEVASRRLASLGGGELQSGIVITPDTDQSDLAALRAAGHIDDQTYTRLLGNVRSANRTKLINELVSRGTNITPREVVIIFKAADGGIVWLEEGNSSSGLQHIKERHSDQFQTWGVQETEIPEFVQQAITDGNHIGTNNGAPVYLVGDTPVTIVVGDNGYVVTAYPSTDFERF